MHLTSILRGELVPQDRNQIHLESKFQQILWEPLVPQDRNQIHLESNSQKNLWEPLLTDQSSVTSPNKADPVRCFLVQVLWIQKLRQTSYRHVLLLSAFTLTGGNAATLLLWKSHDLINQIPGAFKWPYIYIYTLSHDLIRLHVPSNGLIYVVVTLKAGPFSFPILC